MAIGAPRGLCAVLWRNRHKKCIGSAPKFGGRNGKRELALLKAKMKGAGVTYVELVDRLRAHGFEETEASITMKLKWGTFAATWLFACLAALEFDGIRLEHI